MFTEIFFQITKSHQLAALVPKLRNFKNTYLNKQNVMPKSRIMLLVTIFALCGYFNNLKAVMWQNL